MCFHYSPEGRGRKGVSSFLILLSGIFFSDSLKSHTRPGRKAPAPSDEHCDDDMRKSSTHRALYATELPHDKGIPAVEELPRPCLDCHCETLGWDSNNDSGDVAAQADKPLCRALALRLFTQCPISSPTVTQPTLPAGMERERDCVFKEIWI